MGGKGSKLRPNDLQDIRKQTLFTDEEIKKYYNDFKKNCPTGKLTEDGLAEIYRDAFPEGGEPGPLAEQMFRVYDVDKSGFIDFKEFMCGIVLLANGKPDQKLRIMFQAYDADSDGFITTDEFQTMIYALCKILDPANGRQPPLSESASARAGEMFKRMDTNKDQRVSFDEFASAARSDPEIKALLENH